MLTWLGYIDGKWQTTEMAYDWIQWDIFDAQIYGFVAGFP